MRIQLHIAIHLIFVTFYDCHISVLHISNQGNDSLTILNIYTSFM